MAGHEAISGAALKMQKLVLMDFVRQRIGFHAPKWQHAHESILDNPSAF